MRLEETGKQGGHQATIADLVKVLLPQSSSRLRALEPAAYQDAA